MNGPYSRYLELSGKFAPTRRPWLREAMRRCHEVIRRIFSDPGETHVQFVLPASLIVSQHTT